MAETKGFFSSLMNGAKKGATQQAKRYGVRSASPINEAGEAIGGVFGKAGGFIYGNTRNAAQGILDDGWNGFKQSFKGENGNYEISRMVGAGLGTYMVGSTVGRLASGGGIYKDADGNTDFIGIPFI